MKKTKSIIRTKGLCHLLQISRSTVWRLEKNDPTFPKRLKLGQRSVGYILSEVEDWISNCERVCTPSEIEEGRHE